MDKGASELGSYGDVVWVRWASYFHFMFQASRSTAQGRDILVASFDDWYLTTGCVVSLNRACALYVPMRSPGSMSTSRRRVHYIAPKKHVVSCNPSTMMHKRLRTQSKRIPQKLSALTNVALTRWTCVAYLRRRQHSIDIEKRNEVNQASSQVLPFHSINDRLH